MGSNVEEERPRRLCDAFADDVIVFAFCKSWLSCVGVTSACDRRPTKMIGV